MSLKQRVEVTFSSEEFTAHYKSDLFSVTGFEGIEAISEPFRFDVDLISDESEIDLTLLVGKTATLEIGRDENVRKIHGVILNMEQGEEVQFNQYSYKAVLVPRLHLLSLSRQNQIYQEQTVPQIVNHEILEGDFSGGIAADDIDSTRLSTTYLEREYVVQYKETDLDFISRLMEHEGIYYYFEHSGEREKLVLCDSKSGLDTLLEENTVPYVPASGMAAFEDEAIHNFRLKQTQITSQITLKDFNYRKPNIPLQGDAETCDLGYGRICDYGDHFKDSIEGDKLAKIRAEVELCKLKTCSGKSDAIGFQAGKLFEIQDHFREDLNGEYLITRIHHRGGQALPGVSGIAVSGEAIAYQNEFDVIPSEVEFRPALKTPKPKLYGILNGTIDGAITTDRAQIDDQGRYKLIMPFDLSGTAEGKASRWVRKAESYGGQGTGMHFPLLKGTEVIWTCIDGDPDRPIITGVVANPQNKSVVSTANSNDNVIKTASGVTITMKDGKGTSPQDEEGTEQGQTRMASVADATTPATSIPPASAAVSKNYAATTSHAMTYNNKTSSLIQQQQHINSGFSNNAPIDLGDTTTASTDISAYFTDLRANSMECVSTSGERRTISNIGEVRNVSISRAGIFTWPTLPGDYIVAIKVDIWTKFKEPLRGMEEMPPNTPLESARAVYGFKPDPQIKYFKFTVAGIYFSSAADTAVEVGDSYSYQTQVKGGTGDITYAVTSSGGSAATFNGTSLLTWASVTTAGTYPVTISATDSAQPPQSANQGFTIIVKEDVKFVSLVDKDDNKATAEDETQKSYSLYLPEYRKNTADKPAFQYSYTRIGSFYPEEMTELFGGDAATNNVFYSANSFDPATGLSWKDLSGKNLKIASGDKIPLTSTFKDASEGGHKIMDVLHATRETYSIKDSPTSSAGLFEGSDPARFGLMEYTDGAKLIIHQNGCFDLAAGTSVTYDSLGEDDSLISVVLGENDMLQSERFHKSEDGWVTETWDKTDTYGYLNGNAEDIIIGDTWSYHAGFQFSSFMGATVELNLAGTASLSIGVDTEVKVAGAVNFGAGIEYSCVASDSVDICAGDNELKGDTVLLQYVEPTSIKATVAKVALSAAAVGAIYAPIMGTVAMNQGDNEGNVTGGTDTLKKGVAIPSIAVGAAATVAGMVAYGLNKISTKVSTTAGPPVPALLPYVKVEKDSITLHAGASSIVLKSSGVIEIIGKEVVIESMTKTDIASLGSISIESVKELKAISMGAAEFSGSSKTTVGFGGPTQSNGVNVTIKG